MKSYLIVIPARGGSKGIPDKNIVDVGGKPLIAYTIGVTNEVLAAGINGEMVVSTDSEKIASIAKKWGGNVPFLRPDDISGDDSKSVDVILHALDFYKKQERKFNAVILLQPTTPLRTIQDIQNAIELFETVGQPSLISTYKEDYVCDLVSYHLRENIAYPINPLHNKGIRRQEHETLYIRNGVIYITCSSFLHQEHKVISDEPAIYVMPKHRSINIDTPEDLELLSKYL
jgi:CMP-N-acetylneuraminic acid synthetase